MIKIDVYSTRAVIRSQEPLTVGLVGAKLRLFFSNRWKSLIKTVVFRQGEITRDVVGVSTSATIPWEVLQEPGVPLEIGIYGTDSTGAVVIPTVWASTDPVCTAVDPGQDPGTAPSPEVWEQILAKLGNLDALDTENRTELVSAINEVKRSVCLIRVTGNGDACTADKTLAELNAAYSSGKTVLCYWTDRSIFLPLAVKYQEGFHFVAVVQNVEYNVRVDADGILCGSVILATDQDRLPSPEKLTFTGAVEAEYDGSQALEVEIPRAMPGTLWVKVTHNGDGTYSAEPGHAEILEAHKAGRTVSCKFGDFLYRLLSADQDNCVFSFIHMYNGTSGMYSKVVISSDNSASVDLIRLEGASAGTGGLSITDDGNGNVVITSTGSVSITDDGEGNVTIG